MCRYPGTTFIMAYLQRWRKRTADVRAIAENSSSDEHVEEDAHNHNHSIVGSDGNSDENDAQHYLPNAESDVLSDGVLFDGVLSDGGDSDYGIHAAVVSSSDSDLGESDEDNPEENANNPLIEEELATWATKHSSTRIALNEIIDILRRNGHRLPKDARTLLQTPRMVESVDICGGKFAYFGIASGILRNLAQAVYHSDNNSIQVNFNIDGVPLFKSNNTQFWPILCSFHTFKPFIVALFCGKAKPHPLDAYLADFIQELQQLQQNGITYNHTTFAVSIRAIICDAPARSFLKCVKGHSGYDSCERCTIHGTWKGRVVFNSEDTFAGRTDQEFSQMHYNLHQTGRSPLIDANISCVGGFPLDYMHLVCLGVMKRLLSFLKQGPNDCRLSARQKTEISTNLVALNGLLPSEFARQPRSLLEMDRWKATEFRQFLLYTGPVVLRRVVSVEIYQHFLCLCVSLSIMLQSNTEKRNTYLPYAQELLVYFVKKCKDIYGETFTVYNVHGLLHLHEDVRFFQCSLNGVSGFPYENHLQVIKKLVRTAHNPIAQVSKRLTEMEKSELKHANRGTVSYISSKRKDNCFLLQNEDFAFVREKRRNGQLVCDCLSLRHMESFFHNPCDSKLINIAIVRDCVLRDRAQMRILLKNDLCRKVVCLPHEQGYVLFPLLHGVERN